jgi:hypothetical protein
MPIADPCVERGAHSTGGSTDRPPPVESGSNTESRCICPDCQASRAALGNTQVGATLRSKSIDDSMLGIFGKHRSARDPPGAPAEPPLGAARQRLRRPLPRARAAHAARGAARARVRARERAPPRDRVPRDRSPCIGRLVRRVAGRAAEGGSSLRSTGARQRRAHVAPRRRLAAARPDRDAREPAGGVIASPVPSPGCERIRRRSGPCRHFGTEARGGDLVRSSSTARE